MVDGEEAGGRAHERRAYPRFKLTLNGLCSVSASADVPCNVIDMSMGGAALVADIDVVIGAAVTASLPQVGLLRGRVARVFPGGFAMAFEEGRPQRERVSGFLIWHVARELDDDLEDRSFERIVPLRRVVSITVPGGLSGTARIIDVSRSGVALTTTAAVCIGNAVTVGAKPAIVVRVFAGGFAARFVEPLAASPDATIIL